MGAVSAREGVALTPLKGNSANSVCGTFNAGALKASQSCRDAAAGSRERGEAVARVLAGPARGKSIASGVEQRNGWLITELLTYRSLRAVRLASPRSLSPSSFNGNAVPRRCWKLAKIRVNVYVRAAR